jgi:hypothetical protein
LIRSMDHTSDATSPELMLDPLIDRALEESAGQALAVDSKSDSRSWLEERREIIRTVRGEPAQEPSQSNRWDKYGLNWLLSVFGL